MSIKKPDFDALLASFSSEKFKGLRDAQTTVLTRYAERHLDTPDIAIELPTSAGKSLIALLIGEAWRKEGRTVALLTGNKALAVQMEKEGNEVTRRQHGGPQRRLSGPSTEAAAPAPGSTACAPRCTETCRPQRA
jgi:superfamily II DNA or RNA helicase